MRIAMVCARGHQWHAKTPQANCPYCGGTARPVPPAGESAQKRGPAHLSDGHAPHGPPPAPPPVQRRAAEPQMEAARVATLADKPPHRPTSPIAPPALVQPPSTDINWAKVEVAPSLPMMVFTSSERWNAQRIGAMAIYCSDGRWGDACDEFCHRSLLIPRYDRFAVPGGPAWICQANSDEPELYRAAHGQLEFLVREHGLDRIVLITHYDCAFYKGHLKREARECLPAQFEDVKKAAAALRGWFKEIAVEGYLAMRAGNVLSFHQLEL